MRQMSGWYLRVGEVELDDSVLVIRRIHVRLKLKTEESNWESASRVHGFFASKCPIYRSLAAAIQIHHGTEFSNP